MINEKLNQQIVMKAISKENNETAALATQTHTLLDK